MIENLQKVEEEKLVSEAELEPNCQVPIELESDVACEEQMKQPPVPCDQVALIISNLDQEIKMEDLKQESHDNEEFNLSQIQIKEEYFEETTDEDLDKKITSAKKNYFEFSESDKDFNQFEESKQNEEETEFNKANENEDIINDDSVPGNCVFYMLAA